MNDPSRITPDHPGRQLVGRYGGHPLLEENGQKQLMIRRSGCEKRLLIWWRALQDFRANHPDGAILFVISEEESRLVPVSRTMDKRPFKSHLSEALRTRCTPDFVHFGITEVRRLSEAQGELSL